MGNRRFWHIALFLLFLVFINLLLFTKPFIGVANNGDFCEGNHSVRFCS